MKYGNIFLALPYIILLALLLLLLQADQGESGFSVFWLWAGAFILGGTAFGILRAQQWGYVNALLINIVGIIGTLVLFLNSMNAPCDVGFACLLNVALLYLFFTVAVIGIPVSLFLRSLRKRSKSVFKRKHRKTKRTRIIP